MGIFGQKAGNRAEAARAADVFTAPERERIEALWRLTALPRAEFDATYGAMLGGFWRYAASARGETWAALRRESLGCAVAALRARQARVLPRFAAAEDAARLAEVMSFALAACVVAERFAAVAGRATAPGWRPLTDDVPESAALLLARRAGEAGLGWLGQEPAALHALAAYFGDGPSELRRDRRGGGAPDRPAARSRVARVRFRCAAGGSRRGGSPGRPATTSRDGRARARPRAGTAACDRRRGRGLGVDQLGAGGLARRLRGGQRRRRLAAQHRGRGVRGGPGLLRGVRRRARARPGHGPQPRGPARSPPAAGVALGRGQPLPRCACKRRPRRGHGVSGGAHLGRRSAVPDERRAGPQAPVSGPCRASLRTVA